jgi:UDPglucose--hexose-1-phosphate uridylyltransferase
MTQFDPTRRPHRRHNPLTGEWVQVSPHRLLRPWQGQVEDRPDEARPVYDPRCYLCPGNERAGGARNPAYTDTFVFTNDFAAVLPDAPAAEAPADGPEQLLRVDAAPGTARVLCFSPRHDLTLPEMDETAILKVVEMWVEQAADLGRRYRWVQVFENKGEIMGCSNPHPHGQVWAVDALPNEPAKEERQQRLYYEREGRPLLMDYVQLEGERGERVVEENGDWLAVVPFWAVWPFETMLLPRRHVLRLPDLSAAERRSLAAILRRLLIRYDNLFNTSFPYSMGWHGAPFGPEGGDHWQLHAHFLPPLLRSATIKKFMVGYELLAEAQRDLTAEQAAARLRGTPEIHYRQAAG